MQHFTEQTITSNAINARFKGHICISAHTEMMLEIVLHSETANKRAESH